MEMVSGRAPTGQATRASHGAKLHRLHHTASVLRALIERIEAQPEADGGLDRSIQDVLDGGDGTDTEFSALPYTDSIDDALRLLPKGADWRRLTDRSVSAYAANPYNAAAQKWLDGFGKTVALQICSAALKVRLEPVLKAIATEARRAETLKDGSVHEGAGPQDIAQNLPPNPGESNG